MSAHVHVLAWVVHVIQLIMGHTHTHMHMHTHTHTHAHTHTHTCTLTHTHTHTQLSVRYPSLPLPPYPRLDDLIEQELHTQQYYIPLIGCVPPSALKRFADEVRSPSPSPAADRKEARPASGDHSPGVMRGEGRRGKSVLLTRMAAEYCHSSYLHEEEARAGQRE